MSEHDETIKALVRPLAQTIAQTVHEEVERATAPLLERIEALERLVAELRRQVN